MLTDDRPRVLVVNWNIPGPSETFIVDHLTGLADQGWAVTFCCVEGPAGDHDRTDTLVGHLDRLIVLGRRTALPAPPVRAWRLARERVGVASGVARHAAGLARPLRAVLAEVRPDLVHAHYGTNAVAASVALQDSTSPLVADLHGFDLTEVPRRDLWGAYRRLRTGATVVVHSEFAAGLVRDGLGIEPERVPLAPAAVFRPAIRPDHWGSPLRLLFVGRLVPQKGPTVAVEALSRLHDRRPDLDARLTVIGDGPDSAAVRSTGARLGLTERITLQGPAGRSEVAEAMADHDVLLVPSRPSESGWVEAFGLTAAEGVASGMGVVASRLGGLPEAVGGLGVLVDPDDADALAGGVVDLLAGATPAARAAAAHRPPDDADRTAAAYDRLSRSLLP